MKDNTHQLLRFEAEVKDIDRQIKEHVLQLPLTEGVLLQSRNEKKELEKQNEEER
jgi:hypothetical protein